MRLAQSTTIAVFATLLLASACAKHEAPKSTATEAKLSPQKPVIAVQPQAALPLQTRVSDASRAAASAVFAAFEEHLKKHPPKPKLVFEVPALMCCSNPDHPCVKDCMTRAALFYSDVGYQGWGLGPFTIDDDGVFWIADEAIGRAAAFDRNGKLVGAVRYEDESLSPVPDIQVTKTELRLLQPKNGGYPDHVLRYSRDGKWLGRMNLPLPDEEPSVPSSTAGHTFRNECNQDEPNAVGTFELDGRAFPAPGCVGLAFVGSQGDFILSGGAGFWHFDAAGKPVGLTFPPVSTAPIEGGWERPVMGKDGKIYALWPRKKSVQMVELVFSAPE